MTWRQGGAYALLGPSGCGKTTLLNLISASFTPSRGKILFDGSISHPAVTQKRISRRCSSFGDLRHHDGRTNLAFPLKKSPRSEDRDRRRGSRRSRACFDLTP